MFIQNILKSKDCNEIEFRKNQIVYVNNDHDVVFHKNVKLDIKRNIIQKKKINQRFESYSR